MSNQTGGPGVYTGTGNAFDGSGSGTYVLEGDGSLGLTGDADAAVQSGTIANITLGVSYGTGQTAELTSVGLTALAGSTANVNTVVGTVQIANFVASGGTISIAQGVTAIGNVDATISNGGQFGAYASLLSHGSGNDVTFGNGGGTFTILSGSQSAQVLSGLMVVSFGQGDNIDDQGIRFSDVDSYTVTGNGTQTLTFLDGSGQSLGGLNFSAGTFSSTGTFVAGSGPATITNHGGVLELATCFLPGTLIATPSGDRPIEDLAIGDMVNVVEHGGVVARAVVWAGGGSVDTAEHGHRSHAYPVRIRANAIGPDLPRRDLMVTPEHSILLDGGLVPVRMLVNDASIVVDRSKSAYEFFHVELERHGVLLAEGIETESYLDSGNRSLFDGLEVVTRTGHQELAAPLTTDPRIVEPIWRRLRERAMDLGYSVPLSTEALTSEPAIRLALDDGSELSSYWHDSVRYMFRVPSGNRAVGLLSRSAVPAEVVGPYFDDRRTLGVAVEKIVLWEGLNETVLSSAKFDLPGWHTSEEMHRWTNGFGVLDLPIADHQGLVDVHVTGTLKYPVLLAA